MCYIPSCKIVLSHAIQLKTRVTTDDAFEEFDLSNAKSRTYELAIRGHVHMTSAKFWGFLTPPSSAFHATYQYCLSAKLVNS